MRTPRFVAAAVLGLLVAALAIPQAGAAETELTYSIKDARAFLWQIHYPQSTFVTEKYSPCDAEADTYDCDRTRYNQTPGSCADQALGRTEEAPETPGADDAEGGVGPSDVGEEAAAWPKGNPVQVIHGLALGRLGTSPESGGLASMYYVENSGRRETEAHVESDGFVGNRNEYEERCAVVDAFSETSMYDGPFAAHMLSRSDQKPSTYNMAAFTTAEASTLPPGQPKESVSIVKLWEADGRVHGVLTSTVRAVTLAEQITVDLVRSVISFSSDGTEKGLKALAKTEALGLTIMGTKLPALSTNNVVSLGDDSFLGVAAPVVQSADNGRQINIRAPGLFLATNTPLNELPVPEDPFDNDSIPPALRDRLKGNLTLGGAFFGEQVVYVAGAILDAGVGRVDAFQLGPIPPLPNTPLLPPFPLPPIPAPPTITDGSPVPPAPQPVGLPRFEVRELAGNAWPFVAIVAFTVLGLLAVMGRWAMRYPWTRSVSHVPPFPAIGWVYRAFLKG